MTLIANTAEGGSNGTAVTAANSGGTSGDPWAADPELNGGTLNYSTTQAQKGTLSYEVASTSTGRCMVWWTPTLANKCAFRFYIYWTGRLSSSAIRFFSLTNSGNSAPYFILATDTSGHLIIQNGAGTPTTVFTSTGTFTLNTWYRVEGLVDNSSGSASGTCTVNAYLADSGTTESNLSTSLTGQNFGTGTFARVNIGRASTASGSTIAAFYLDDLAYNDGATSLIGASTSVINLAGAGVIDPPSVGYGTISGGDVIVPDNANTAEGGTNTTAVTAANSGGLSGTAWSVDPVLGTGGAITFSTTQKQHGSLSYAVASGTDSNCYLVWNVTPANSGVFRGYFRWGALAPSAIQIVRFANAAGNAFRGGIYTDSLGRIGIIGNAGTSLWQSTSSPMTTGTWYRIECAIINGNALTGSMSLKVYTGDSTTEIAGLSHDVSGADFGTATIDRVHIGRASNGTGAWSTFYVDDVAYTDSTTTLLGPSTEVLQLVGLSGIGSGENVGFGTVDQTGAMSYTLATIADTGAVGLGTMGGVGGSYEGIYTDVYGSYTAAHLDLEGAPIAAAYGVGLGSVSVGSSPGFTRAVAYLVEIGFGNGPTDTTVTWTDVTDDVLDDPGVVIKRGRSSERDRPTPGTANFTLKNGDRTYDPSNSAGPYYGQLLPRTPVRVSVTVDSTRYTLFRGVILDGFPQKPSQTYTFVDVDCVDALGYLASIDVPDSIWAYITQNASPKAWFRFDSFDTSEVVEQTTGSAISLNGRMQDSGNPLIAGSQSNAALSQFRQYAEHWQTDLMLDDFPTTSANTLEMWFRLEPGIATPTLTDDCLLYKQADRDGRYVVGVWVTTAGKVKIVVDTGVTRYEGTWGPVTGAAGALNPWWITHLVIVPSGTTASNWLVYWNGQPLYASGFTTSAGTVGNSWRVMTPYGNTADAFQIIIDELVIYDRALTASEITTRYTAGATGNAWDPLSTRFDYVIDASGWPVAATTESSGILDPLAFEGGRSALDVLQQVDASEQGFVYADREGAPIFRNRAYWWTATKATTSQLTFSDAAGAANPYAAKDVQFALDDVKVINEASVSRKDGRPQVSRNTTSIATYGTKSYSLDNVAVATDGQARDLADWFIYAYNAPTERIDKLTFYVQRAPTTLVDFAATVDLGELITVNRTPQGVGSQSTFSTHTYGITHKITNTLWEVSLDLSAARTGHTWFTWETSTWGGTEGWAF